jgi:glutamate-5-semialdehyde dehydrogenase
MVDISQVRAGDRILVGGQLVTVSEDFVRSLEPGDRLVASADTGVLRRIPRAISDLSLDAVSRATQAFASLSLCDSQHITQFFSEAARLLSQDDVFEGLMKANNIDVQEARRRGRSVTRLELTSKMRLDMIAAFEMWRDIEIDPLSIESTIEHIGWKVEQWRAPLGVIAFVFEGRPNVFADATGVLRSGNSVVFRIGSDALNTAQAIMDAVITPALLIAGLPNDSVVLLASKEHAAGWALFSDTRLSLAVARGSGTAVKELGSIARQAGVPVSLHGTGGAWLLVGKEADLTRLAAVVEHSLDRKVCNTLNVVCVLREQAAIHVPIIFDAAQKAASSRKTHARIHCVGGAEGFLPSCQDIEVTRADGVFIEPQFSPSQYDELARECEWEVSPEFFIALVDTLDESVQLFNTYSPQFVVSVISNSEHEREHVWRTSNAPFVGDGFTRWVDGQFALNRPELGLSNWEFGRLFGRGGVLSGDSAFTVRLRVIQNDANLAR